MSRSLSHRSLSRRSRSHRWPLVILAVIAAAVFLVAWFGMATVSVPEQSHAESMARASDTDAAATSEFVDNATARRQRVSRRPGDGAHGRLIIVDATTAQPIRNQRADRSTRIAPSSAAPTGTNSISAIPVSRPAIGSAGEKPRKKIDSIVANHHASPCPIAR